MELATPAPDWSALALNLQAGGHAIEMLCTPGRLPDADARNLARAVAAIDPMFDATVGQWLTRTALFEDQVTDNAIVLRGLEMIAASGSTCLHILPILLRLQRIGGERIRSKAAAMIVRANRNSAWLAQVLAGDDPRVIANTIEGLWDIDWPGAATIFESVVNSPNNRVAGNAIVGLFRLGRRDSAGKRLDALANADNPVFRSTAAWALGMINHPPLRAVLMRLARDPDANVRRNAIQSLVRIRKQTPASNRA